MSSASSRMSLISTSKRSACDRCRKQKLRCPPRTEVTRDCARCVRADAVCITGYTKPLGRCTLDCSTEPNSDVVSTPASSSSSSSQVMPETSHSHHYSDSMVASDSMEFWSLSDYLENGELIPIPLGQSAASSIHSDSFQPSESGAAVATTPLTSTQQSWNQEYIDPNILPTATQPVATLPASRKYPSTSQPQPEPRVSNQTQLHSMGTTEYNLRLSQLHFDLAQQLSSYRERSERRHHVETAPGGAPGTPHGPLPSNAFGSALRSTSELLDILRPRENNGDLSYRPATYLAPVHGNLTCILGLLLSYLQLVAIFDLLFHQLHETLSNYSHPQGNMQSLQILPDLCLSGFTVNEGGLQIRILLQATQHQFELIERELGIPAEYTVFSPREGSDYVGSEGVGSMFHVILDEHLRIEGTACSSPVTSLRTNITRVEQLVHR